MTARVRIEYGGETVTMSWDASQAKEPIFVDGEQTPYQTANARHSTAQAVRLAARYSWPEAGDFSEGSEAWDALSYGAVVDAKINVYETQRTEGTCDQSSF